MKKKKKRKHHRHPYDADRDEFDMFDEPYPMILDLEQDRLLLDIQQTLIKGQFAVMMTISFLSLLFLVFLTLWIGHVLSWIAGIIVGVIGLASLVFVLMLGASSLVPPDHSSPLEHPPASGENLDDDVVPF